MSEVVRREGRLGSVAVLAFGCIYLVWGSTYLAIRFAVEALPPFLMAGGRCLVAGFVLLIWARLSGTAPATSRQWRLAVLPGALFFVGAQGVLSWAERFVPSGAAALLVATMPIWMILLGARRKRPTGRTIAGVVLGLGGVALLVVPAGEAAGVSPLGGGLVLLAALSWALGSLVSRATGETGVLTTALHLLCGGVLACIVGAFRGELAELAAASLSARSLLAFAYLTVFGSLVTFSAYSWLLRRFEPAIVGTYAFVNPVFAVLLGWALGGEALGVMALAAAAGVVVGVYLVVTSNGSKEKAHALKRRRLLAY